MKKLLIATALVTVSGTAWAQELSENPYGVESTSNPYGQYGSPLGIKSVNNPFGRGIPLEPKDVDSGLKKGVDRTEALDELLAHKGPHIGVVGIRVSPSRVWITIVVVVGKHEG